ncbi:SapC family protein [Aquincola sp. MAHUQ-54]|uniref:SapC family protein n=1 Tax=Aquincola agrisoli TaxID=3119538 RepID=A0AAW9Q936_9BURK
MTSPTLASPETAAQAAPAPVGGMPLFYRRPRVLRPALHAGLSLAPAGDYRFAASANAVPLLASELPTAARHFPIVFSREAVPHPMAVLGLRAGHNAFVEADGRWRAGSYMPAYVRRHPFIFVEGEGAGGPRFTLCVDEEAATVVPGRGNPFFDEAGQPTAATRSALDFCRDYQMHHHATAELGRALLAADLLVEHRADVALRDGERLSLSGFRVIDEARFAQLPDETFLEWRAKGWLPAIYAQLGSASAWSSLIDRLAD